MSIHPEFDNPQLAAIGTTPIVLRFQGLHPGDLGRFSMHDKRTGGDLSHVDTEATASNEMLFGEGNWKDVLRNEIDDAKKGNLHNHVEALRAKSRKAEASNRQVQGLLDPWQRCRKGPLREGIITVNKAWFGGTGHAEWDVQKVDAFREAALIFLKTNLPNGELRYASGHADEEAYHIHFVVAVWRERVTANRGQQILLQASMNPLVANYEHAQDLAGEAFTKLGLTRGQRHAEARRQAKVAKEPMPEKPRHIPPSRWRAEQRVRAHAEAEQIKKAAQKTSGLVVADGVALAKATIRKSRKRAIKEALARKEACAREIAAKTHRLADVTAKAERKIIAADAAENEMRITKTLIAESTEEMAALEKKMLEDTNRLQAERAVEMETARAIRVERAVQEAARDKAKAETDELTLAKESACGQLQLVTADLKDAKDQTASVRAAARVAHEQARVAHEQARLAIERRKAENNALEKAKAALTAEEAKLRAAQVELKEVDTKKANVDHLVNAVMEGLELIADGILLWKDKNKQKPGFVWGAAAPVDAEKRQNIRERIRPALSFIGRIAQIVNNMVSIAVAAERKQLAEDSAYLIGLRDDWDAEERAKLEVLNSPPDFSP
jgi:hypothetical protein